MCPVMIIIHPHSSKVLPINLTKSAATSALLMFVCFFGSSTHHRMTHWVLQWVVCDTLLCRPTFLSKFRNFFVEYRIFQCASLFKLSDGHPVLNCLLRHYVSAITGNRHSQNALSSPRVCVYSKYCQETRLARTHVRLYALSDRRHCLIALSQSDNVIFRWGKTQTGYLLWTKYSWFARVTNEVSYSEDWNTLQLWASTAGH